MKDETCLVLGGGGVAGIAWMTGLLRGLAEAGDDLTAADLVIGTSAGSTVAAQLGSGLSLEALFARQAEAELQAPEIPSGVDLASFAATLAAQIAGATSAEDGCRRIAAFALEAKTVSEAARREVIAKRLPSHEWPTRRIQIVAVDASTGLHRVFDRASGVSLVDAVAASCAVPGVWPPVTIGAHRYVDGGVRSPDNADLAAGFRRIVVLPTAYPLRDVESVGSHDPRPCGARWPCRGTVPAGLRVLSIVRSVRRGCLTNARPTRLGAESGTAGLPGSRFYWGFLTGL